MNTVKIGNDFENKSYDVIYKALNNKELSLIPEHCKIYKKKRYSSDSRSNGIVFDLSIEVTPPNSNQPTLLYLIECKKYSSSITVDEVALFAQYISQIKNYTVKGVFITNNKLQKGAFEQIKHSGMMLIEVNEDEDSYNIVHYKKQKINNQKDNYDKIISRALCDVLAPQNIDGLKKLSSQQIDNIASNLIKEFSPTILERAIATPLYDLLDFLKMKYNLQFKYAKIQDNADNNLLGYFNSKDNTIYINSSIKGTIQEPFVIGHEIGHFILHKNLKVNNMLYNNFRDTSFNLFKQSFLLKNPKNWIEWQANCFSASLLLPEINLKAMLIIIQKDMGISKEGSIFLDEQECNKKDFCEILKRLAQHFKVSKITVEYRLNSLKLIKRPPTYSVEDTSYTELLRTLYFSRNSQNW